jgi:adenine deaminase
MLAIVSCNPSEYADVVITNGKIITVDKKYTITEALAVTGDRIVSVGSEKMIKKLIDFYAHRLRCYYVGHEKQYKDLTHRFL